MLTAKHILEAPGILQDIKVLLGGYDENNQPINVRATELDVMHIYERFNPRFSKTSHLSGMIRSEPRDLDFTVLEQDHPMTTIKPLSIKGETSSESELVVVA